MSLDKHNENLIAQKAEHRRLRFARALFNGTLTKRNRPDVRLYSGPIAEAMRK